MSNHVHLSVNQGQRQSLKQSHRLMMSPQMQQAISMLQMPIQELALKAQAEISTNPIFEDEFEALQEEHEIEEEALELAIREAPLDGDTPTAEMDFKEDDYSILTRLDDEFQEYWAESGNYPMQRTAEEEKLKSYIESSVQAISTLFDSLMQQAHDTFTTKEELRGAEQIIGNLDESGFLTTSIDEIASLNDLDPKLLGRLLKEIQRFRPYGIGAADLQESLLIQLECHGLDRSLGFRIVRDHFDDLLHNRIPILRKKLGVSSEEIERVIDQEISHLDLHPGAWYSKENTAYTTPDLTIDEDEEGKFHVRVNNERMPALRINRKYLKMLTEEELPEEVREYIQTRLASGKWLLRNIYQRDQTLKRLGEYLLTHQRNYLTDPQGSLKPMTMKEVAEELDLHESTIARAVANKYLFCPRGLLPLRSLFTGAYETEEGTQLSSSTVKTRLQEVIANEDKSHPLSDEAISNKLKAEGIDCARRTVAKYRQELNLGNASQRRKYGKK
jgi:RNA polymerase sigma-54 factor